MTEQEDWETRLDVRLSRALPPPQSRPGFRQRLRRRIRQERAPFPEGLPDALHLAGCAVVTLTCAAVMPLDAAMTFAAGTVATLASYVLMTAVRSLLDEV